MKPILLLDVMSTLVTEPYEEEVPRFFGMTLEELWEVKDPSAWIEFEHGDSKYPVWTGCFLREGVADLPLPVAPDPNKKIIRTDKFMITIDDSAGKLSIDSLSGPVATPRITIQNNVLTIENGASPLATIEMNGNSVAINGTALEVT